MKSLSFLRHAESDYNNIDDSDFDRPIKKSGLKMTKICAEYLKKNNISYDLLFCSPALRTKQTSSYFLSVMNLKTVKVVIKAVCASKTILYVIASACVSKSF